MAAWLSLISAVLAYGTASLLQAYGARRSTAGHLSARLALQLARNAPYVLGTLLDIVAVLLIAHALRSLPLFLVQAAASASLCVTAVGSALLFPDERHRQNWGAVLAVTIGLTLLGSAAVEGQSTGLGSLGLVVLATGLPVLLGTALLLERTALARPGVTLAALAGLAYAGMGISLRALEVPTSPLLLAAEPEALTAAGYMGCAFLLFARALQRCKVTQVMAVVVSIDTILPAGIGLWLLGDRTRAGWAGTAAVGLVVTVTAVLWMIRTSSEDATAATTTLSPQPATTSV
jgi:hypothetical protein